MHVLGAGTGKAEQALRCIRAAQPPLAPTLAVFRDPFDSFSCPASARLTAPRVSETTQQDGRR